MDGWMDGRMDGWMDGWMDRYRDCFTLLNANTVSAGGFKGFKE